MVVRLRGKTEACAWLFIILLALLPAPALAAQDDSTDNTGPNDDGPDGGVECHGENQDCDGDGANNGADCRDLDATIYPGAPETANGVDDDCDGEVDEGFEEAPDQDSDGVPDSSDNCPGDANADQANVDGDATGDACDAEDNRDSDSDGVDNFEDACPGHDDAEDLDSDGQPDGCDSDRDGDGDADVSDNCVLMANPDQLDTDGDASGDACDADDDNDAILDGVDNCPLVSNSDQLDTDGDASGDACDTDDDNDGDLDGADNCVLVANADQLDSDGDGIGDLCDTTPSGDAPEAPFTGCGPNGTSPCPLVNDAASDAGGDLEEDVLTLSTTDATTDASDEDEVPAVLHEVSLPAADPGARVALEPAAAIGNRADILRTALLTIEPNRATVVDPFLLTVRTILAPAAQSPPEVDPSHLVANLPAAQSEVFFVEVLAPGLTNAELNGAVGSLLVVLEIPASYFSSHGLSPLGSYLLQYHDSNDDGATEPVLDADGQPVRIALGAPSFDGQNYSYEVNLTSFSTFAVVSVPLPPAGPGPRMGGGYRTPAPAPAVPETVTQDGPADTAAAAVPPTAPVTALAASGFGAGARVAVWGITGWVLVLVAMAAGSRLKLRDDGE